MNPLRLITFIFSTLLICATTAQAQLQLSTPTHFNHLKLPGSTALGSIHPVPASQFSGVGVSSGSAGPRNQAVPTAEPRFAEGTTNGSTSIKLTSASVGNAFATGVPRYYLGDFITPPLVQADKITPAPAGYWRAKPVRDNETFSGVLRNVPTNATLTNPVWNKTPAQEAFYYSPHADAVFASQPGAVEIVWVTTAPQGGEWKFWRETFNVSSATQRDVRTIYWTEKSFNGPRVNIPGGRIERVNPVFSTAFPPLVVEEYVPVGQVINPDPNGQPAEEKRTLWFDKIGGNAQIAAYNLEGRVLVEYLGQEIAPNRHQFLGADVVQVARRAPPTEVTTHLGRRVLPHEAMPPNQQQPPLRTDTTLIASPVLDLSAGGGLGFYGTQGLADGRLAYWAERENLSPDRVVFYWLENQAVTIGLPGAAAPDISVLWPKYQDRYFFIWPPLLSDYAFVTTDPEGSTAATGLQFEAGSQPEIVFQDDGSQTQSRFDPDTRRLITEISSTGDSDNRTLLKFTSGTSLWYQTIYSQTEGRSVQKSSTTTGGGHELTIVTVSHAAGLEVGMFVTGPGIHVPITITEILSSTQFRVSFPISEGTQVLTYTAESDGLPAIYGRATVGTRLEPPSSKYSLAGHISSGRCYQPSAYIDPFTSGVSAAGAGAIIPVNALPTDRELTVRWFEPVNPPAGSTGFTAFHVPSKVGRYTVGYPGSAGDWRLLEPLRLNRGNYSTTLLNDGRVLVAGGRNETGTVHRRAEIFNPTTNTWSETGALNVASHGHKAVKLANGKVLVIGGYDNSGGFGDGVARCELFEPETGTWTTVGSLGALRDGGNFAATALADGRVLVAGGGGFGSSPILESTEIFNPTTGTWAPAAPMNLSRSQGHHLTLLANGKVLVTGGLTGFSYDTATTAELYDPVANTWTNIPGILTANYGGAPVLLADGRVLSAAAGAAEIYNPATNTWTAAAAPPEFLDYGFTLLRLQDGRVLAAGQDGGYSFYSGYNAPPAKNTALYNPVTNTWSSGPPFQQGRERPDLLLLPGGHAFAIGGWRDVTSAEMLLSNSANEIVMASNEGTENLTSEQAAGFIYQQNNHAAIGFNPNEEHAVKKNDRFWALRDDLNVTTGTGYTSEPFVLVAYTDPADGRPAMRPFRVLRENATYTFNYEWTAGLKIQGPMPLPLLQLPVDSQGNIANTEVPGTPDNAPDVTAPDKYDSFTLEDRQGYKWVYRGTHNSGGPGTFGMQWYYPMDADFYVPGGAQPAAGTKLPYLRPLSAGVPVGHAVTGTALTVSYTPKWPENVPSMRVAETLTLPKFDLPEVRNQKSAEVYYQQSIAKNGAAKTSVTLHDPTRAKKVTMAAAGLTTGIPGSIRTSVYQGKTYFQGLPPHLQTRFYFAPLESASGSLVFVGEFYDEIAGEDYLDLNVLSAEDEAALIKLAEFEAPEVQTKWSTAISTLLKTRLETYIEDPARKGTFIVGSTQDIRGRELAIMPDSDTARDSYALTATGQGTGYVTLVFADGSHPGLTPAGDPPAVKIIQVLPELYKGDLKVRLSSNPLDEKVTLRHSGDFAAKPEDYEFEWRHSGPVDGKPPRTYTYTNAIYLGDSTNALEREWKYVQNPTVPRPAAAAYSSATWELPRLLTIKDAAHDPASGLPGVILKANQDVDFTSGVPSLITFSTDTDHLTGFVLYVNGAVALVHGNGVAALDALISENAYDLRLARAASLDDLPVEGESLVVVAEIAAKLHFRIFNAAGVQVFDAGEAQLSGKSAEIAALKTRLTSLWAITNLAANDKIAVVSAASAIAEVDLDQDASTGLSAEGLTKQFRVHESFFIKGPNRIEVALYTDSDADIESNVNLRLEGSTRTDLVESAGNWEVAASPATTESPKIQNRAIVGGSDGPMNSPLVIMSDRFFTMRYRPKINVGNILATGGNQSVVPWSDWTRPALVEGWIKRVLAAINPFNQRMTDLYNNAVDTDVSLLTQAGTKWEGDIALTLDNISDASLIAIYETVLNRGKDISINSGYDVEGVNTALLLAAGYLNDLYTILGDEAFADAANPTISLDDQNTITEVNTSRFSFEGQVASSLEEELALLRGRDDFLSPQVTQSPFYNRLFWNYTRGINSGEALYAVNYNIKEKVGSSTENGILDAADAQRMFPQGHGDAYGHYLTALKGYYKLLTHRSFTWKPQIESVSLLGNTISVDYKDERKFAQAAAKVAATAEQVVALTHRQQYNDNPRDGWVHFRDGQTGGDFNNARHWGLDEWASRAGQGSYYHWVVGNAMVKEEETVLTGIQKIDRSTVLELQKLPLSGEVFQTTLDNANAHLNPLGLSPGAIAFDISPAQLKAGNSHYEQVYGRALGAVLNAKGSFDQAGRMTRLLRNQENQIDDFNTAIEEEERAFKYKLIDLYGTPYPGDVGPGRTYVQNYSGPDLNNWFVVDRPTDLVDTSETITVEARVPTAIENFEGFNILYINALAESPDIVTRTFEIQPNQFVLFADQWSPDNDPGRRSVTGKLQQAMTDAQLARMAVLDALDRMSDTYDQFDRKSKLYQEILKHNFEVLFETDQRNTVMDRLSIAEGAANLAKSTAEAVKDYEEKLAEAASEAPPKSVGTSSDATSGLRSAIELAGLTIGGIAQASAIISEAAANTFSALKDKEERDTDYDLATLGFDLEEQQLAYEYELEYKDMVDSFSEVSEMALRLQKASEEVRNLAALGDRLQLDRQIFRQRAAAIVQGYRTKDLTFRVFRNEALEQYRTLFDLASRYTYLAAKSYDYETGLLGTPQGQTVFRNIVASRALGDLTNGVPQATVSTLGDSGLAGTMAQLNADFSVAEGRLGINNPDQNGTLFSLRKELFRLPEDPSTTADDDMWQQTLEQHIVSDLMADPDVAAQCLNLRKPDGTRVPGIVITFGSTIEHGKNYFGLGTAAGDHNYSPSNFATKIYSAGVVLPGYIGMDPYAFGSPNSGSPNTNGANALNATPYLYLIPVGMDRMLAPPLGDTNTLRSWSVHDQALPLPYNLGGTAFNGVQFFNANGTLSEQPWILRKHQAFRPVDDPAFFYSSMPQEFTSSRLIGRSVWNTTWKIVIPAYSLLENEQDGLNRFTATVRDIQLFLRTYSNAGN